MSSEQQAFDKAFESFLKQAKKKFSRFLFGNHWPVGLEILLKTAFSAGWSAGAKECLKIIKKGE